MSSRSERENIIAVPRTLRLLAFAGALLLSACDTDPSFQERGYPQAPRQELPSPAPETTGQTGTTPLAELADPSWVEETADRADIPQRVLTAYAGASLRLAESRPECGLGWNTLAGIGSVESAHASFDGAAVDADGRVDPPIIGIPLDGSDGVLEISDTDGGDLDGDPEWDRAVGPMQFIPTTWQQYAQDGDLDGESHPQQIDDAVLTAAVYLCDSSDDLTDDEGWAEAVTTYNNSLSYARQVAELSEDYSEDRT